jgi:hypothetical protein
MYGLKKSRCFRREKVTFGKIENPVPFPPLFEPEKNIVFPLFGRRINIPKRILHLIAVVPDVRRGMKGNGTVKEILEVCLLCFELILVGKILPATSATFAEVRAPGRMCGDHSVYNSFIALAIPVSVFFASPKTIMVLSSKKS